MMLSKNNVKFVKSLRLKKFRQKYNNFIVEGDKMVRELLAQRPEQAVALYALESWLSEVEQARAVPPEKRIQVSAAELKKISSLSTPNQVVAVAVIPEVEMQAVQPAGVLSLYLDGIQDPGNFGTILRIADWFGVSYVFSSPESVDAYHPKVVQATMGAFLRVSCIEMDIRRILESYPGLPVYGAVMDGDDVFRASLSGAAGLLVIGNEGRGITPEAERLLSHRISIPAAAHSRAESLNAAVAAGILCAVFRDRQGKTQL